MNATSIYECESVTRAIARWGSIAAAVMFGTAFVTDKLHSYSMVNEQTGQICLIAVVFVGYLLAWKIRFEVVGSIVTLAAVAAFFVWNLVVVQMATGPFFLAIALPALFHLLAVAFHRSLPPLRSE